MNKQEPIETAQSLVNNNKGILAMDESTPTCNKRFAASGIPQNEETRRTYREILITTPGLSESISGAILCDEIIENPDSHSKVKAALDSATSSKAIIACFK